MTLPAGFGADGQPPPGGGNLRPCAHVPPDGAQVQHDGPSAMTYAAIGTGKAHRLANAARSCSRCRTKAADAARPGDPGALHDGGGAGLVEPGSGPAGRAFVRRAVSFMRPSTSAGLALPGRPSEAPVLRPEGHRHRAGLCRDCGTVVLVPGRDLPARPTGGRGYRRSLLPEDIRTILHRALVQMIASLRTLAAGRRLAG